MSVIRSVLLMAAIAAIGFAFAAPHRAAAGQTLQPLARLCLTDDPAPNATPPSPQAMHGQRDRAPLARGASDPNKDSGARRAIDAGARLGLPGTAAPSDDGGGVPVLTQRAAGDAASVPWGIAPGCGAAAAPWCQLPGIA